MSNKTSCIAVYDFYGDSSLRQLTFHKDAELYIKHDQQPQNGWLWATCYGQSGWIPSWAVALAPPTPPAMPPPPPQSLVIDRHRNRPRLSDVIDANPIESQPVDEREPYPEVSHRRYEHNDVTNQSEDGESNGFDLSNGVMGGQIPRPEPETQDPSNDDMTFDVARKVKDSKRSRFLGRFLKTKVQPLRYPTAKEPEWNPLPQIIYDGKVIQEYALKKRGFFQLPNIQTGK
jgi:hypothetical protein